jgi:hypothetical protein
MSSINKLDKTIMEIKKMLLKNESFRKLLYFNTPDCLSIQAPTLVQVQNLVFTTPAIYMEEDENQFNLNSFAVIYIPIIDFSKELNDITFIIDLFTKKELIELDNNQLRLHQLVTEIYETLDNKRVSLAGRIQFSNASYVNMGNRYIGFQVEMSIIDQAAENDF